MECAGKGRGTRCFGPARRRCGRCGAVAYCSASHQLSHWSVHKEECGRLEEQMKQVDLLNDFPFTLSEEATVKVCENHESRCSFLRKRGIHLLGMWLYECSCGLALNSIEFQRIYDMWSLPSILCPCSEPVSPPVKCLLGWDDYYKWRNLPLHSPVAVLLHWPLTIYHAIKLAESGGFIHKNKKELRIHFLGPEKELVQFGALAELRALLPGVKVYMVLAGPAVPQYRDGERINLSVYPQCTDGDCMCKSSSGSINQAVSNSQTSGVTLHFRRGLYHEVYEDIAKHCLPDLIIAPNAGIAAYPTWLPTIELIKRINVPAVFSDYCEEACHLAAHSINPTKSLQAAPGGQRECTSPPLLLELLSFRDMNIPARKRYGFPTQIQGSSSRESTQLLYRIDPVTDLNMGKGSFMTTDEDQSAEQRSGPFPSSWLPRLLSLLIRTITTYDIARKVSNIHP